MIPGQGSQYPQMGKSLYVAEPHFRSAMDDFFNAYGSGSQELKKVWNSGSRTDLAPGFIAQPLLFAIGYATARTLLRRLSDQPMVLLGHSVGELAAATVAGVFDISLAAELMRVRARALRRVPAGGMIGVRAEAEVVERLLHEVELDGVIGAVNAPQQCVVSLAEENISLAIRLFRDRNFPCMRIPATEPFHSPLMIPCAQEQRSFLKTRATELRSPKIPLFSSYSANWIGIDDSHDPNFWTRQIAEQIRFGEAIAKLLPGASKFIEVGPGMALTSAVRAVIPADTGSALAWGAMPTLATADKSWSVVLDQVSGLRPAEQRVHEEAR